MISTRLGAVIAILISVAALALGIVAFMSNVRNDGPTTGRLVQSQLTNEYDGPPVSFALDEFFLGRGTDGVLRALYQYPPGYYGHIRGCKLVWDPASFVSAPSGTYGPGLFVDPCGGARFTRDGKLVAGSADRDLDYFATSAAVDGTVVDTRRLLCGGGLIPSASPTPDPEAPRPHNHPQAGTQTCDRVSQTPNTREVRSRCAVPGHGLHQLRSNVQPNLPRTVASEGEPTESIYGTKATESLVSIGAALQFCFLWPSFIKRGPVDEVSHGRRSSDFLVGILGVMSAGRDVDLPKRPGRADMDFLILSMV